MELQEKVALMKRTLLEKVSAWHRERMLGGEIDDLIDEDGLQEVLEATAAEIETETDCIDAATEMFHEMREMQDRGSLYALLMQLYGRNPSKAFTRACCAFFGDAAFYALAMEHADYAAVVNSFSAEASAYFSAMRAAPKRTPWQRRIWVNILLLGIPALCDLIERKARPTMENLIASEYFTQTMLFMRQVGLFEAGTDWMDGCLPMET